MVLCQCSIMYNSLPMYYVQVRRSRSIGRKVDIQAVIPTKPSKICVQVNVQLFRILHIDDTTENVTLDLGISFLWDDPHVAAYHGHCSYSTHPHISRHKREPTIVSPQLWPGPYQPGVGAFDPAWKIENCSDTRVIKDICMVIDPSIGRVHQYIHLVVRAHHRLDMVRFPIDTQKFCFQIRSEHTNDVMEFIKFQDGREPRIFNPDTTEWAVLPPLELAFETGCAAANGKEWGVDWDSIYGVLYIRYSLIWFLLMAEVLPSTHIIHCCEGIDTHTYDVE